MTKGTHITDLCIHPTIYLERGKGALYDRRKGRFTSILVFVLQKKIWFFEEQNSAVLRKCYCHLILSQPRDSCKCTKQGRGKKQALIRKNEVESE